MLDFLTVASEVVRNDPALASCRPVIEKELLHYEILGAMNDAGLLRHLTFKGGTCLRLCYGGLRFSEDLDFSGGAAFDNQLLDGIEGVLRNRIGSGYGLDVTVKLPRADRDGRGREVSRWIARVVTRPEGPVGVQRIKIEIDRQVHAPEDVVNPALRHRYELLQDYFAPFPIRAASLEDICADKIIAFPMSVATRENPRYRDIWDIEWITRRLDDVESVAARASRKAIARGLEGQCTAALATTIERGREITASKRFRETLQRFLPKPLAELTIEDAGYRDHLTDTLEGLFASTLQRLRRNAP